MYFCNQCGYLLPPDANACPACGTPAQRPAPQYAAPPHPYYPGIAPVPETPLSTGQYLGCLVLFAVPLVGLVFMLMWSFSSTCNPARKRLARAYLIRTCIFVLLFALVMLALALLGASLYSLMGSPYVSYYGNYPFGY